MTGSAVETRCEHCDEPLPATARFCLSCGASTASANEPEVRKTVTLLFCDVTGSTAMGEQLDPEALRAVMGRYFASASAAVERHGGTVEKFVGDAVLAVFGIPEVREDDALRAVRAAVEMRDALAELSSELLASMDIRLAVRTGVNTGSVVAGTARAGGSFATGDAVNTAARLEQAAAPGQVLIGASTLSLVRDAVEVEPVEPLTVKGKADPLPAFRLVRVLDTEHGRRRRLDATLVGRDRESRALTEALARTTEDGRGQLITVLGTAGMGKTRLVDHFLLGIDHEVRVLRGRCLSYGRGITFWPVVQLLRQAAGLSGEETENDARLSLRATLVACPDVEAVLERLLPLMGLAGEPGGTEETFWAVRTAFEHLASVRPLVVVVDDVHWAEPTLLDLLERVRDEARDVPLLMLCQARPELLEQRPNWGGGALNAMTFNLEPFTGSQTAALMEGLLGDGVRADVVAAVDSWADGNPLFVEEVTAHLVEVGVLISDGETWSVQGDLSAVTVPTSVTALLAARLDRLPTEERTLIERISVVGLEVTTAEAQAMSPDSADVPALLASLVRRDLLRRTRGLRADTWAFRHVLVREAAYDALPKSLRADLHERFASRLEESAPDAGGETAAFVGHHLEQAARFRHELSPGSSGVAELAERAAAALGSAADQAYQKMDFPAADDLVARAIALTEPADPARRALLWLRADIAGEQGRVKDALRALGDAADMMDERTPSAERAVLEALTLSLRVTASEPLDPALLSAAARTAAALARTEGDQIGLARALRAGGSANQMTGIWEQVAEDMVELLEIGTPQDRSRARFYLGAAHLWGSRPVTQGRAYLEGYLALPGLTAREIAFGQSAKAAMVAMDGDLDEALALSTEAERAALAVDSRAAGTTSFTTVQVHNARGDLHAAIASLDDGIEAHRSGGGLAFASTLLAFKAALLLESGGRDQEAQVVTAEAAAVTSPYDTLSVGFVESCRAVLAARAGDQQKADLHAAAAMTAMEVGDQISQRADVCRWLSEVPARRGDVEGQRRLLTQARDYYRAKGHVPLTARTECLLEELAN